MLGQMVTRAADSLRERSRKAGQQLRASQVDPDPVWLEGDATRLEQVLSNLLNNAIKFTPAGGRITLKAAREANEAVIRVKDTGVGIEERLLPKVFDLFVQADASLDRSQSGLGIGLALVRQVVTMHGGERHAPQRGTWQGQRIRRASAGDGRGSCSPA